MTEILSKTKTYHFIGVGGIGMSGIAQIMLRMGYSVSGSDLKETAITKKLKQLGASIYKGHRSENVKNADVVVLSSAVLSDNPELVEAKSLGLSIFHRAEMLGFLMNPKFGIAIAGAHGKTTTTSMVSTVLDVNGFEPTVVVGGEILSFSSNANLGQSNYFVVEADESDCSFLSLNPKMLVVTNIDMDVNLGAEIFSDCGYDYDKTFSRVFGAFRSFIDKIDNNGYAVLCKDCPNIRSILGELTVPFVTYGIKEMDADFTASDIIFDGKTSTFRVFFRGKDLGIFKLNLPGEHNVVNSLASIAIGLKLGIDIEDIKISLEKFIGVGRRFQVLGEFNNIMVVDDYAHNPTKIRNAMDGIKKGWPQRRSVAVFQPHRYSRMKILGYQLKDSFSSADVVIVTDIYSAGEQPVDGINPESLIDIIKSSDREKEVLYVPSHSLRDYLLKNSRCDDIIIALGAGDITYMIKDFYNELVKK